MPDTTTEGVEQLAIFYDALAAAGSNVIPIAVRPRPPAPIAADRAALTAETLRGLARERDAAEERAERAEASLQRALDALARADVARSQ